jgi:hypothetical protein
MKAFKVMLVLGLIGGFLLLGAGAMSRSMAPASSKRDYAEEGEQNMAYPSVVAASPPPQAPAEMDSAFENAVGPSKKMMKPKAANGRGDSFGAIGGMKGGGIGGGGSGLGYAAPKSEMAVDEKMKDGPGNAESSSLEAAPEPSTRAWFPETFLFEPLIVTDAAGRANVPVKIPDRLTTWRVLALAHSREGTQAGSVASFLGTLPVYVDAVTPPQLFAGDEIRLPIQAVNTTENKMSSTFAFTSIGGTLSSSGNKVDVPAYGSAVQYTTLKTTGPGSVTLKATLGTIDAMEKMIPVLPAGRRELISRGGTLGAPRNLEVVGIENPLPKSESIRLQIFPGALGLLRSELSAAPGRGGIAEDAYLLQLLGEAPSLLKKLGGEPDMETIRDLSVLASQRAMRYGRAPSLETATLLSEGSLTHPENPVLMRLGERLSQQIAASQRGDGSCQGATGWTLQRLMVATSECVRAAQAYQGTPIAKQRAMGVQVKAGGFYERNLGRVNDGYTAAAILYSGAVSGTSVDTLKKLLLSKITKQDDGSAILPIEEGVARADGTSPNQTEATALAALALKDDPLTVALGTSLLSNYNSYYGFGDGRTNLMALRAVVQLFSDPVPSSVKITLERDGKTVAQSDFNAAQLKDVMSMEAPATGSNGKHQWTIRAEPAVAGLAFSFNLAAYAPWKNEGGGGLEVQTTLPAQFRLGQKAQIHLVVGAPAQLATALNFSLPAGVQPDSDGLNVLVSSQKISRFETQDGKVTLHVPASRPGETVEFDLSVVPTLAGQLTSGEISIESEGNASTKRSFAPGRWNIVP